MERGAFILMVTLIALAVGLSFGALGWWETENEIPEAPPEAIRVIETTRRIEFPGRIVIRLVAEAPPDVDDVRIDYAFSAANASVYAYPDSLKRRARGFEAEFVIGTGGSSFVPQGVDVEYYFTFTDSNGVETTSPTYEFEHLDPRYDWRRMSFDDFTLYYHHRNPNEARAVGGEVSRRLERVKAILGLEGDFDYRAVIVNSHAEGRRSFPAVSRMSAETGLYAGFALGNYDALALNGLSVNGLIHELTHLMLEDAVNARAARVPAWLNEGLAMYFETPDGRRENVVRDAFRRGRLMPLRNMGAVPGRADDVRLFYSQSASIVRFMADAYGERRLTALFAALDGGMGIDDALRSTYGFGVDELDAAWRSRIAARV